jgi:hypothetical protein
MASRSGGHRRGWNGQRGTPWRRVAQDGVEGVGEWLEEAGTGEVLTAEQGAEQQ